MTDDVRAAAERITRSVHEAVYTGPLSLQGKLADALIVADAVLAEHPADDGEAERFSAWALCEHCGAERHEDSDQPVTEDWLRAVVPGFEMTSVGGVGGVPPTPTLRLMAHRQDGGGVWAITAATPAGECGVRCTTRGHVRRLCAALGIPITETPK